MTDAGTSGSWDWGDWVSATATRNWVMGVPIEDWYSLYGASIGVVPDDQLPDFDPRTDFRTFFFEQGRTFEERVVDCLRERAPVERGARDHRDITDPAFAERTRELMAAGTPIIHKAVLHDPEHRVYGEADLLIRSDTLLELFPDAITDDEAAIPAPDLPGAAWHYRVIDVKFSTLRLTAKGYASNGGSVPAYKVQLYCYNRALGRLQGFEPDTAYLLGRGWEQTINKEKLRGSSALERVARVPMDGEVAKGYPIAEATEDACAWIRELRTEGAAWTVGPEATRDELYFPEEGHVSELWMVGGKWALAEEAGVTQWRDPACTPELFGLRGKRAETLRAMLDINRSTDGVGVHPPRITAAQELWREQPPLEFYVDFETVSDIGDDFSNMPHKGGEPIIFMVGCGHIEDGEWVFECFIADRLDGPSEAAMIDAWLAHMEGVRARLSGAAAADAEPPVIHWSPAETSTYLTAYNSAVERHPEKEWRDPAWFDFLELVVQAEPMVVRGAHGFGLKTVAKSMHELGHIETSWGDGPTDGMGAMIGAWWCDREAAASGNGTRLIDIDLMSEIRDYNEVDCKVMMEIIRYLRTNH